MRRAEEEDGPPLLERHGLPPALARFAGTHAAEAEARLAWQAAFRG